MMHTKYFKNINDSLSLISFDHDLISMYQVPNRRINGDFFVNLLILCRGFKIFDTGMDMLLGNVICTVLYRLHFISITKVALVNGPWSVYIVGRLTPLGYKFIKHYTNLEVVSEAVARSCDSSKLVSLNDLKHLNFNIRWVLNEDTAMYKAISHIGILNNVISHRSSPKLVNMIQFLFNNRNIYIKLQNRKHLAYNVRTLTQQWMFARKLPSHHD